MLMSADSSDSHASGNQTPQAPQSSHNNSNNDTNNQPQQQQQTQQPQQPATSAKTSVICMPNQAQPAAQQPPTPIVQAAPASSTTPATSLLMGRSHLENALKLPPNTSVSTYYQHTKLLTSSTTGTTTAAVATTTIIEASSHQLAGDATPNVVFQQPAPASANSIYERASSSAQQQHPHHHQHLQHHAAQQQQQQQQRLLSYMQHAPGVTDMDTVTSGAGSASSSSNGGNNIAARKLPHSNVIYVNNNGNKAANAPALANGSNNNNTSNNSISNGPASYQNNAIVAATPSATPPPPPPAPPQLNGTPQHSVVSTSDYSSEFNHYSQQQQHHHQQQQSHQLVPYHPPSRQLVPYQYPNGGSPSHQHGNSVVTTYQQHNGGVGTVVVVAADSRPQTPDYIKSYPVMDTTVASSVKGEPELNIEFDGTTVLCRVCGDKASGFHYGVHSCEGCKGFFRRSIQQKIQYRPCTKNQQCSILRINRNRCQYCRLKKCIAVGMSRDAVRFGRVPKREKARILAAMQQSTQNRGQQRALATELDDQPRLLAAVLRAHLDTCEFTKEKVAAMRQRARECPSYSMPTLLACPLNPAPELQSEQEFSQRFAHVIRGVIDFAGMIPGFQLLTQDDKFTLLKAGLFDALFVRLICMFDSSINSIICLNGQVMRRDAIQNGANARFLVDSTFNFAERMNSMNLSDAEIGLFCAIVLITPDRPGLRNIELIEKMYSRLKGCLQSIINQNRPEQPEFMSKLLETMPDLRTLSTLHTEKLVVFRTEHKELLRQQMWTMDDDHQSPNSKSPGVWDDSRMDVEAKSPLGSVSSTESGDLDYTTSSTSASSTSCTASANSGGHPHMQHAHHPMAHHPHPHALTHQPSSLASSAPLLAATLSGSCPIRNRANSGSSGDSGTDLDIVGSHAHLTQNGLTITPIVRAHSHQQLHHHLTAGAPHRYRKLDSPTDSGIESGNEKNECGSKAVSSGGSSSCSSPRSSVDDALDCSDAAAVASAAAAAAAAAASTSQVTVSVSPVRSPQLGAPSSTSSSSTASNSAGSPCALKRQIVEDMPVLKRVLQAPPLYDTNSLMDEAYKPHKKFRALRHREYETAEADASSTSHGNGSSTPSTTATQLPQSSPQQTQSPPPQSVVVPHMSPATPVTVAAAASSPHPAPPAASVQPAAHQSQLHMHLTRPSPTTTSNAASHQQQHYQQQQHQQQLYHHQQQVQQQQHSASSLSSTHSVLAKSLMAEPRMTPEQIKRSDIIQNYIMRDNSAANASSSSGSSQNGHMVCTPNGPGSRSPAPAMHHSLHHGYASPASSSSSSNSNCASPSTTTVTLASPPPPPQQQQQQRWPGHTVITTTTCVNPQRQQSVSPNSQGSSSSNASSSGCQYFQSPHSTSISVSPPRRSPAAMHTPPPPQRMLELQVDIADSQQPLNLSKKSPTPPPSKLQALVAAASAVQRYPTVSADVTVTATTSSASQSSTPTTTPNGQSQNNAQQVHKVMLEA